MATITNISISRGRRWAFTGTATQGGVAFNLTGYSGKLYAKYNKADIVPAIVVDLAIDEGAAGTYSGVILPSQTKDIKTRMLNYELVVWKTDDQDNYCYTIVEGLINLADSVVPDPVVES